MTVEQTIILAIIGLCVGAYIGIKNGVGKK